MLHRSSAMGRFFGIIQAIVSGYVHLHMEYKGFLWNRFIEDAQRESAEYTVH
jgi:glycine betaine/choline ABC-type transport system substrate-binding protein